MLASDRAAFEIRNLATGGHLADCAKTTKEDVDAAMKTA